MSRNFEEMSTSSGSSGSKKGIYLSKTAVIISVTVVIALLVAEGLLVGLLARPTCNNDVVPDKTTTSTTTKATTTTGQQETTLGVITESTPQPEIWENSRLPTNLIPEYYQVKLRPVLELDPATDMYLFYGSSSVRYLCNVSTEYVIVHSRELDYDANFTIVDESDKELMITDSQFYLRNSYVVITTASACVEGMTYTLTAPSFHGELGDDLYGIYRSEYYNEYGEHRVIAVSQMQTTGARRTFPCFDEPAMKAVFEISMYHRSDLNYTAISNMPPVQYTQENIEGITWNLTRFNDTPIMSTYLLALVVSDFSYEDAFTADGIQTRIYARNAPVENNETAFAADVTPTMLTYLAEYYDMPYPLPKCDQLSAPDFDAGAMENWGLVLYRETLLLFDPVLTSVYNQYSIAQVIGHELAHMWFGNLVTTHWWSDLWLNEGFASYVQYIGVGGVFDSWKLDELFITDDLQGALSVDSYSTSHPLYHPQGYFSTISYSKGASFLRMVNNFLGEETFTNALKKYLDDLQYQVATHDQLFHYWTVEADLDGLTFPASLQDILETWVLQMGYPLLTITREGTTLTVTQEHYLVDPSDEEEQTPGSETYKYKWYVPFTYKTSSMLSSGADNLTSMWMNLNDPLTITLGADDYILANIDAAGFYRVFYDEMSWTKLVEKLNSSTFEDISPQNRAQLIDDSFELIRSGHLNMETVLDMTLYLSQELDYIPWYTYLSSMAYFERMLGRSNIYGDFSGYVLGLVVPLYEYFGWDDTDTSDDLLIERFTRGLAVEAACEFGYKNCTDTAAQLYRDFMMDPENNIISATYRIDVYCTAIRAGGVEEWDFAWNLYLNTDNNHELINLRYGLSCSKDPWILNRYIEYCLDDTKVRKQDVSSTLGYIGRQEYGKHVAWSFAVNNWELMMNTVGQSATSNMLSYATRRFSTQFDLELIEILRPIAGGDWNSTLNSFENTVRSNMAWRATNEAKIAAWLGIDAPGSSSTYQKKKYSSDPDSNLLYPDRFLKHGSDNGPRPKLF